MCRAAESATKQAKEIAAGAKAEVNRINSHHLGSASSRSSGYRARSGPVGQRQTNATPQAGGGQTEYKGKWKQCKCCGRHHSMELGLCPALWRRCNVCNGENHFAARCPQKPINHVIQQPENNDDYGPDSRPDGTIGLIRVVDNLVAALSAHHKA